MAQVDTLIELRGLVKSFERKGERIRPIHGLDLTISKGEVLAVLGQSGCGKTTLLRLLAGLDTPDAGTISMKPGLQLGLMFQEPRLLPWKSVRENIELALIHETDTKAVAGAVDDVLRLTRMSESADSYPSDLSGGMAQRVALARALVTRPDVLLLDEPFGALDALTRRLMQRELSGILQSAKTSVFLVTHDVSEALMLADRIVLLEAGKIQATWCVEQKRPRCESAPEIVSLSSAIYSRILGNAFS